MDDLEILMSCYEFNYLMVYYGIWEEERCKEL